MKFTIKTTTLSINALQTIDQHIVIRETIGYEGIANIEVYDLPQVLDFLQIVYNYQRMNRLIKEDEHICPGHGS
jgi:hypothetical protein